MGIHGGFRQSDVGPTKGRKTVIIFDAPNPLAAVQEPYFTVTRKAQEVAKDKLSSLVDVEHVMGAGIRLKSTFTSQSGITESSFGQNGQIAAADVDAHPSLVSYKSNYDEPDNAERLTTFSLARAVSGGSFATITSKAIVSGSPVVSAASNSGLQGRLVRVMDTLNNVAADKWLLFRILVMGNVANIRGDIFGITWSSIPTCEASPGTSAERGVGRWHLRLDAEGIYGLYELVESGAWLLRDSGSVGSSGPLFSIMLGSDAFLSASGYQGTKMAVLDTLSKSVGKFQPAEVVNASILGSSAGATKYHAITHKLANLSTTPLVPMEGPVSVDVRSDLRTAFSLLVEKFKTTGSFIDSAFDVGFYPTNSAPLVVTYAGSIPSGTSISLKLYRSDTDAEVTGGATLWSNEKGGAVSFALPSSGTIGGTLPPTSYYVKFTLNGDGERTPTITRYTARRVAIINNNTVTQTRIEDARGTAPSLPTLFITESVEINGATENPAQETARATIAVLGSAYQTIKNKRGNPVDIVVLDENDNLLTVLFRGRVAATKEKPIPTRGTSTAQYPKPGSFLLEITCESTWARMKDNRARSRFSPDALDQTQRSPDGQPYATEWARECLYACGIPDSRIDIPSLTIPMFAASSDDLVIESGDYLPDRALSVVEDYFGARLIVDHNAGTDGNGMVRMSQKKAPPYNYLAKFYRDHPGSGKLIHAPGAYPDVTNGSQTVKCTYMEGNSIETNGERAEGNAVIVYGGVSAGRNPSRVSAYCFNPVSFNPFNLAPGHTFYPNPDSPDYLENCVLIEAWNYSLTTQEAVNWYARRIFDQACFGREYVTFTAPLLFVTDVNDSKQYRPRALRAGDVVQIQQVDGTFRNYILSQVNPRIMKDFDQGAQYQAFTQTNIDSVGQAYSSFDLFSMTREYIKQSVRAMTGKHDPRLEMSANKGWQINATTIFEGFPHRMRSGSPLQYLDPGASTFGQFRFLPGYDVPA